MPAGGFASFPCAARAHRQRAARSLRAHLGVFVRRGLSHPRHGDAVPPPGRGTLRWTVAAVLVSAPPPPLQTDAGHLDSLVRVNTDAIVFFPLLHARVLRLCFHNEFYSFHGCLYIFGNTFETWS